MLSCFPQHLYFQLQKHNNKGNYRFGRQSWYFLHYFATALIIVCSYHKRNTLHHTLKYSQR